MKILIILGHPTQGSFNHAIAKTAKNQLEQNGHEVIYHDLYVENFDPLLITEEIPKNATLNISVNQYCKELMDCNGIIVVHPNWWGQPPAIVKGWIDRVIRPGVAYVFEEGDNGEGVPIGLLQGKSALVFNTANTSEERENNIFKDPLETIWKNCIFDLCGIQDFYRKMFRIVVTSTENGRIEWLKEVAEKVDLFFPKNSK
jgi:NAD(P)H dehydrogenase (quinone)